MNLKNYKSLYLYLKTYKFRLMAVFLLMIFTVVISLQIPLIVKKLVDSGLMNNNIKIVLKYSIIMLAFIIIQQIVFFIAEIFRTDIKKEIKKTLYQTSYKKICHIKLSLIKNRTELYNQIYVDIENISKIADKNTLFALNELMIFVGGAIGLCLISWKLALVTLVFIPIKSLFTIILSRISKKIYSASIEANSNYAQVFNEIILGIEDIRIFGLEFDKKTEVDRSCDEMLELNRQSGLLFFVNSGIDAILSQIIVSCIYIFGAVLVFSQDLSIGSIFAFISYTSYVLNPLTIVINLKYVFSEIMPSVNRMFSFIDSENEINGIEPLDNKLLDKHENIILEFKSVYFTYNETSTDAIFNDLNFVIKEREKVVIKGDNGHGKSTIINLVLRFITPQKGEIYLYQKNINEYDMNNYRNCFSIVSQNIFLFNRSIQDNIILNKELLPSLLYQILSECNLIELYEERKDDPIGWNGINLSGGQKQKIALARALYQNKNILIFDEVTSSLDEDTKKKYINLFNTRLKSKTVIIITHDNNFSEYADNVISI